MKKKQKIIVFALLFPVLIASSRLVPLPPPSKVSSQIVPVTSDSTNYTVGVFPGEEFGWIITSLSEENLELAFGSNWTDYFGLFGDPQIGHKFKINVSSTQNNGTHDLINYDAWDCLYRLTNFSAVSDRSCRYEYPIEPQNYTDTFEFDCVFPLFLPTPVVPYVIESNLTNYDAGDYSSYGGGLCVYYDRQIIIDESTINLEGIASYLENGALDYFQFFCRNGSEEFKCLTMESFKPYHLEPTSMACQAGEEFTWVLVNYNLSVLEYFFEDDFFETYGILPNPERMQSVKMKVDAVSENNSHWLVDYSVYNWTSLEHDFPESSVQNNSYEFKKEPFNESRSVDASIPFLIPEPTDLYLRHGRLGNSYMAYYDFYSCVSFSVIKGEETMWGSVFYNRVGVLTSMRFCRNVEIGGRTVEQVPFELALYYDSATPDYVGIEEGAQLNYDIYTNDTLEPYISFPTKNYESAKIEIIKIFGEEVVSGSTVFIANFSLKRDNGAWDLEEQLIVGYIHGDNNMYFDPLTISRVGPFYLAPLFVNNRMNWTEFAFSYNNYNGIMNSNYYAVSELQNGFELHYCDYQKNITFSHKYNETGFLSEYTIYYNEALYHNCSVGEVFPPPIVVDTEPPVITVINPSLEDVFGTNPPEYHVTVEEENLNRTWYWISNGSLEASEEIGFSSGSSIVELTGQINESLWNLFSDGNLTVRFYANDSVGNINWKELQVIKDDTAPVITILNLVSGEVINNTIPEFALAITELRLAETWYVVNGSENFYFTGTSGSIDQTTWNALSDGSVLVQFFALDEVGNLGTVEIVIVKYTEVESPLPVEPEDPEDPTVPGIRVELIVLQIIVSTAAILILNRKGKRFKSKLNLS